MTNNANITADAVALQERDEFRAEGWLKVIAPAKVNLHLAIGACRPDGYHSAATVMHALTLHDVVYLRVAPEGQSSATPSVTACRMVPGDPSIELPDDLAPENNLAARAVTQLATAISADPTGNAASPALELRIEKSIPAQAGLGGGSTDAAAALIGAAHLWGLAPDDARIETVARSLGADVAFFLHGSCAYLEGTGDAFVHALEPSRKAVALVKPIGTAGGVSTAEAYRRFDDSPSYIAPDHAEQVATAKHADEIALYNNLAPASEALNSELAAVRSWLADQPHVEGTLLSGSGAATFAVCDTFASATAIATEARKLGWWSRATSFSSARAMLVRAATGASA